jgi:hypothetical protein
MGILGYPIPRLLHEQALSWLINIICASRIDYIREVERDLHEQEQPERVGSNSAGPLFGKGYASLVWLLTVPNPPRNMGPRGGGIARPFSVLKSSSSLYVGCGMETLQRPERLTWPLEGFGGDID